MNRLLDWLARHVTLVAVVVGLLGLAVLLRQTLALVEEASARRFDAEQTRLLREMDLKRAKIHEDALLKKLNPRRPMAGPRAEVISQ